jgi:hypothetical protein
MLIDGKDREGQLNILEQHIRSVLTLLHFISQFLILTLSFPPPLPLIDCHRYSWLSLCLLSFISYLGQQERSNRRSRSAPSTSRTLCQVLSLSLSLSLSPPLPASPFSQAYHFFHVIRGHIDNLKLLLDMYGVSGVDKVDVNLHTPLRLAAEHAHAECVLALLQVCVFSE